MWRILQVAFRIWCKICLAFCVVVFLIFLFFFSVHVIGYLYCNDKDALQKYAKEVNLVESARQELLLIKKYGQENLDPPGRQEDGTYIYHADGVRLIVREGFGQDEEENGALVNDEKRGKHKIEDDIVLSDEERNKHKAWKEKVKSVAKYSAWTATYYHIRYDCIDEGVIVIPLYGKHGQHSFLYVCFNEDLTPAASPPFGNDTLIKIEDGIYWRYSFWPLWK